MKKQQANLEISRRRVMQFGAGFLGTATLAGILGINPLDSEPVVRKAVEANVVYQLNELKKSSVLSELVALGQLKLVGGYFDFETAEVTLVG